MDDLISKLSEIRGEYNCFDEGEEPYYRALSEAINILSQRADGDTISRQAAIEALWKERQQLDDYMDECLKKGLTALRAGTKAERNRIEEDIEIIDGLPSAQPERKKGRWEVCNILDYAQRPSGRKVLRCPFCGYLTDEFRSRVDYYRNPTNFCPNCGADMREGDAK